MNIRSNQFHILLLLLLAFPAAFMVSCDDHRSTDLESVLRQSAGEFLPDSTGGFQESEVAVEAPPFTDGIYPCMDCHVDIEPNPERRALVDMHDDIDAMFHHDSDNRWCLDCHDKDNRDYLRSASGNLISFDESYKLCGQCHGDKLRDWKVGVHGKRTGEWNGKKHYLLCVHCHNPHSPRFTPLKPLPPPVRQEDIIM